MVAPWCPRHAKERRKTVEETDRCETRKDERMLRTTAKAEDI